MTTSFTTVYVEIVMHSAPDDVVTTRMGPMTRNEAERVRRGADINLNHRDYFTRIVEDNETNTDQGPAS